jgi:acetyl-CoA C-acetyltransferase
MHAIAETVRAMRDRPGSYRMVGANGGTLSKYSVGIYSTTPRTWRADGSDALRSELESRPVAEAAQAPEGSARIETYTVRHSKSGPIGIIVGRLDADDRRLLANPAEGDDDLLDLLMDGEPIGAQIMVQPHETGNKAALSSARLQDVQ